MSRLNLAAWLQRKLEQAWREVRFKLSLRHLHGPKNLTTAPGDVIVMAQVRDGVYYLDEFFAHYRRLGIRHFVFFDNGSTDDTINRIKAEPGTIIDRSTLPLGLYEGHMRKHVAQTYAKDRWCLYADMDEIFDFEASEKIGIAGLVQYLNAEGYTGLVAQMLEMFPDTPIREAAGLSFEQALHAFAHYDISAVKRFAYHDPALPFSALLARNEISSQKTEFFWGGVRGKVFGETCCLTKHPLVFNGAGVEAGTHPHFSTGVRCADITGVVKHYKFANDTLARDAANLKRAGFEHGEDISRLRFFSENPDFSLFSQDASRWDGVSKLIDADFLLRSPRYTKFVKEWQR